MNAKVVCLPLSLNSGPKLCLFKAVGARADLVSGGKVLYTKGFCSLLATSVGLGRAGRPAALLRPPLNKHRGKKYDPHLGRANREGERTATRKTTLIGRNEVAAWKIYANSSEKEQKILRLRQSK